MNEVFVARLIDLLISSSLEIESSLSFRFQLGFQLCFSWAEFLTIPNPIVISNPPIVVLIVLYRVESEMSQCEQHNVKRKLQDFNGLRVEVRKQKMQVVFVHPLIADD